LAAPDLWTRDTSGLPQIADCSLLLMQESETARHSERIKVD